jgi:hypothetical protein
MSRSTRREALGLFGRLGAAFAAIPLLGSKVAADAVKAASKARPIPAEIEPIPEGAFSLEDLRRVADDLRAQKALPMKGYSAVVNPQAIEALSHGEIGQLYGIRLVSADICSRCGHDSFMEDATRKIAEQTGRSLDWIIEESR